MPLWRNLRTARWLAPALLMPSLVLAAPAAETLGTTTALGFETVRLPQGESMGLVGASLLFDVGTGWQFGPAVYGAASGRRGGLFVGGAELRRLWPLGGVFTLATGLYGGGGGGAAAPVGSGLMLRPMLSLLAEVSPSMQAGLTWSQVRFPDGDIRSSQLGLALQWSGAFRHYGLARPGEPIDTSAPSGLGLQRAALSGMRYRFSDGSGRRIDLVGARAERPGDGPRWGLEAAAAASGNAAGYMELLGTAASDLEAGPGLRIGWRMALGLGGGGAVPTGGGVIGKLAATAEWQPLPGWALGADFGLVRSLEDRFKARQLGVWLAVDLEPLVGAPVAHVTRSDWTVSIQHHARLPRSDGSASALDTIGLAISRPLVGPIYVTGQAHSAFAGRAGAYSIGLLGLGVAVPWASSGRAGAELLAGAAGGGGVRTGGGAYAQGLAWMGWAPAPSSGEWRLGLGAARALRASRSSPVIALGWTRRFAVGGP